MVLRSGDTIIRVSPVDSLAAAGYTVLGWTVTDLATELADLVTRGVLPKRFEGMDQDEQGVWQSPSGVKIAWFGDPDVNTLSLTQL